MKHLFVYGSLMFDDVLNQLVNKQYKRVKAEIHGFQCLQVKGEVYPALVKMVSESTRGLLVLNISQEDIKVLDEFEGEYYFRSTETINTGQAIYEADVYLFKDEYRDLLLEEQWDACCFQRRVIQRFLKCYV